MTIGLLTIIFHLHGIDSLKAKRKIVKSAVERIRSRFNASASEVGAQDSKQVSKRGGKRGRGQGRGAHLPSPARVGCSSKVSWSRS